MKTKQEQIEEMANIILNSNGNCPLDQSGDSFVDCSNCKYDRKNCTEMEFAEHFYSAGYRKASDVIEEFVNKMKQFIIENCWVVDNEVGKIWKRLQIIAAEMRQEVEK